MGKQSINEHENKTNAREQEVVTEPEITEDPVEVHDLTASDVPAPKEEGVADDHVENDQPVDSEVEVKVENDRLLRLQAEFLNYKRRVEKEKADLYAFGCEDLAKDLLPVIDNFERALITMKAQEDDLYQGIDMIRMQLIQVLEKHDITEIKAAGMPFDMNLHHAVMTEPCTHKDDENTVADVMQKGYLLKKRVLRPSMVKVYQL